MDGRELEGSTLGSLPAAKNIRDGFRGNRKLEFMESDL